MKLNVLRAKESNYELEKVFNIYKAGFEEYIVHHTNQKDLLNLFKNGFEEMFNGIFINNMKLKERVSEYDLLCKSKIINDCRL